MVNIREFMERLSGKARNLWNSFGYPEAVDLQQYWRAYRRQGIATRIVRSYPDACWRGVPIVQDEQGSSPNADQDDYSAFTGAWSDLEARLRILSYLRRVDRLARVGHYAVLLLGFGGTHSMAQPVTGPARLEYLAVYSERSAKIAEYELDPMSARYGLPKSYDIQVSTSERSRGGPSIRVHHSRVIHVAENTDEDDIFGEPALRPIWNYLIDLEKVVGSGAETFWLNARGGLSIEADPNAKMTEKTVADMKQQIEDFSNDLRRTVALQGAKMSVVSTTVADPRPNSEVLLQLIGGTTGIPKRILLGSESGELASSEDGNSWDSRIDERRSGHCTPAILHPLIVRMIETGNLPAPVGSWFIQWPEAAAASPEKLADVAVKKIAAASSWANGQADRAITREEFRIMIGLAPESEYDLEDVDIDEDDIDDALDEIEEQTIEVEDDKQPPGV